MKRLAGWLVLLSTVAGPSGAGAWNLELLVGGWRTDTLLSFEESGRPFRGLWLFLSESCLFRLLRACWCVVGVGGRVVC